MAGSAAAERAVWIDATSAICGVGFWKERDRVTCLLLYLDGRPVAPEAAPISEDLDGVFHRFFAPDRDLSDSCPSVELDCSLDQAKTYPRPVCPDR
jgi:hypothetical protein